MPFCGNCGHPLTDTDLTCPNCGEVQPNAIPKPDSVTPESQIPVAPSPVDSTPNPTAPPTAAPEQQPNFHSKQMEMQSESPATNIPREVPSQQAPPVPPTTSVNDKPAPDFSAYNIHNNTQNPNPTNQQQPNFSGQSYQQSTANPSPYNYNNTYSTPNTPLTNNNSNGFGIASLILGICSIAICCCYGVGAIPAIIGLILGILQNKKNANGIATAGIILGIIGILLNAVYLIYMVVFLSDGGLQEFIDEFSSSYPDYSYYDDSTL